MAVSQEELGKRLRTARERRSLTQEQVATALGVSRPTVIQVEAGKRSVSSLELEVLSRLFGTTMEELVSSDEERAPVAMLFRGYHEIIEDPQVGEELRRCIQLCRHATRLEERLGLSALRPVPPSYPVGTPGTRWEAIEQGIWLAAQERKRLELGALPVRHLVEIISRQGVRVATHEIPEDISGIFFTGANTGLVIIANSRHMARRRLFSYAHELCHLLADRERIGALTRAGNRDELIEVRANAFAAHFLLPEEGVRTYLNHLGRGGAIRQVHEVFDGWADTTKPGSADGETQHYPLSVQRRLPTGSQEVQVIDAVRLAQHFGTSYEATLYQLLNLKLITKERMNELLAERTVAEEVGKALMAYPAAKADTATATFYRDEEPEGRGQLSGTVLALGLDASARGLLTREELAEIFEDVKAPDFIRQVFLQ